MHATGRITPFAFLHFSIASFFSPSSMSFLSSLSRHILVSSLLAGILIVPTPLVSGYVSSSANYRIQSDSINIGGGPGTSATYGLDSTVGEVATGDSSSASYILKAGYQQMVTSFVSITSPADANMSRSLTISAGTATGSTTWTVVTDNLAGYTMTISASSTAGCQDHDGLGVPDALCDKNTGEAFNDKATTSKATWSVSNAYEFGWSAYGSHVTGFGTGSSCDTGDTHTPSTTLLYQGLDGTRTYQFASTTAETSPSGVSTTLCFAVGQDTTFAPSGSFQATTTATVIAL